MMTNSAAKPRPIAKSTRQIKSVNSCTVAENSYLREIFQNRYSKDEVNFVIATLCSFPNIDCTNFLLLANQNTNSGRFSESFNHDLNLAVKNRDVDLLYNLAIGGSNLFVELFDNDELTEKEFETIRSMYNKELQSIKSTVSKGKNSVIPQAYNYQKLYVECYNDICIEEFSNANIPQQVILVDNGVRYTFGYEELYDLLTRNMPNPQTGKDFNPSLLASLRIRFSKEIKMHRRYLNQLTI